MITTAAVLEAVNEPLVLHELNMLSCLPGQVHVRMLMAGLCGAQLQEIRGEKGAEHIPHLMGHEGCGIVEELGFGVTRLKRGQRVVLHWREGAGSCAGGTHYYYMDKEDHSRVGAGPVHTLATRVVVSENRCTGIDDDVPPELATLLGCALSTALGVLENDAKLRMGESVLVVGCGGVGLSLISAAKMLGAMVSAVDKTDEKLDAVLDLGCESFSTPDKWHAEGPFDCIIDTTGDDRAISMTMTHLAPGGRYILVGQPSPGEYLRIPNARQLFDGTGATIIASQGGQFNPAKDIPRYIRLWRAGLLQAAGITHRFPLERINEGLDLMREGKAGRVVIEMQQ